MTNQDKVVRTTQAVHICYLRNLKDRCAVYTTKVHIMNAIILKVNSTGSSCRESQIMFFFTRPYTR